MAKQTTAARQPATLSRPSRRAPATKRTQSALSNIQWSFPLGPRNLIILGIGIAVIVVGYLLMATGITDDPLKNPDAWRNDMAVTFAPILLVIGYCVIIPFGIFYRPKEETPTGEPAS